MMPDDCSEGWPNCGEIDIMEHVGFDEGRIHGTIHTDTFNHLEGTQIGDSIVVSDATSAFHLYSLEWGTDRLEWSVDGSAYHTVDREPDWGFAEWPFNDKPFHIKINIAVGGSWGGAEGIDETAFPATMDLDYVCIYRPTR
jgi:licheninase